MACIAAQHEMFKSDSQRTSHLARAIDPQHHHIACGSIVARVRVNLVDDAMPRTGKFPRASVSAVRIPTRMRLQSLDGRADLPYPRSSSTPGTGLGMPAPDCVEVAQRLVGEVQGTPHLRGPAERLAGLGDRQLVFRAEAVHPGVERLFRYYPAGRDGGAGFLDLPAFAGQTLRSHCLAFRNRISEGRLTTPGRVHRHAGNIGRLWP